MPTKGVLIGVRPMSRLTLDRVIAALAVNVERLPATSSRGAWARRELEAIRSAIPATRIATSISARIASSDAVATAHPANGLGYIDAMRHPLNETSEGRRAIDGTSFAFEPTIARDGRVAIALQPRVEAAHERGATSAATANVHRAYVRTTAWKFALTAGLDERRWGQSPTGALFISGNSRPLPSLEIGTEDSWTLPGVLRYAGPVRWRMMMSDLGRDQNFPHAVLAGWHFAIQPHARFEMAASVLSQQAGKGAPGATFVERVADLYPLIDVIFFPNSDFRFSNKVAGGSLRYHVPGTNGLDFYYELQMDDFDARRLESSLFQDAAHTLGARLPIVTSHGQFAARAEWHFTSVRLYEHTPFNSGLTAHDRIIGNPLGTNGRRGVVELSWQPAPTTTMSTFWSDERNDRSQFMTVTNSPSDDGFRFVRLTDDPRLRRAAVGGTLRRSIGSRVAFSALTRYDRSWLAGGTARGGYSGVISFSSTALPVF